MADLLVGSAGYVSWSNFLVGNTGNWRCPAVGNFPYHPSFRAHRLLEKKSISRGGRAAPWWAGSAGPGALAMTQNQSIGSSHTPSSADHEKDLSMSFRRVVFDQDDWTRHRSSDRHSRHILSIASSRVIRSLGPPVLKLTCVAALVAAYNEIVLLGILPSWLSILHAPPLPFQLAAPALAFLLVFRTNASYGRFDEARKAWGSNVNGSRDFSRQALTWIRFPADSPKLDRLLRYCVALPFCFKDHFTQCGGLREEVKGLLDPSELEVLLGYSHKPNYILQTMSEIIYTCSLSDMERALLDRNLTQFHDNLGTCERILKTPIPLSYTRLTSRFLVIWHAVLPFALWDQCSWGVIPATFFSAGALFCIEEVGVLIEEPLSIIPLDSLCATMRSSVEGLIQAHADNLMLSKNLGKTESLRISEGNGMLMQGEESSI